jgi:hypothetical protein
MSTVDPDSPHTGRGRMDSRAAGGSVASFRRRPTVPCLYPWRAISIADSKSAPCQPVSALRLEAVNGSRGVSAMASASSSVTSRITFGISSS